MASGMYPVSVEHRLNLLTAGVAIALPLAGCVQTGIHSYADFRSALDSGATCAELLDQRNTFSRDRVLERIDRDLNEIGCENAESKRSDR
jgi:hypothetical protein